MAKIEKIRDGLYIKKGWDGYRVVYPFRNDLDRPFSFRDNCNWVNVLIGGHWSFMVKLLIFLIAFYFFTQMYLHDTAVCRNYAENFKEECTKYFSSINISIVTQPDINQLPNINNALEKAPT